MRSAMEGNIEQLTDLQQQIYEQMRFRKKATWQSYGASALITMIAFMIAATWIQATKQQILVCHIVCQLVNFLLWRFSFGKKYTDARKLEKIMLAVVSNAIRIKKMEAQRSEANEEN